MKHGKLLSIFSAALLGLSAAAFPPASPDESVGIVAEAANEQTFTYGNCEYSYVPGSDNATLKRYLGNSSTVSIPAWVSSPDGWKAVRTIGYIAFYNKTSLTSVSIPSTVTEIDVSAFNGSGLTQVVIPSSVARVKRGAFASCSNLTSLEIQGAATVYNSAFADCTALQNVTLLPNCSYQDPKLVFENCPNICRVNGCAIWEWVYDSGTHRYKPVFMTDPQAKYVFQKVIWGNFCKTVIDNYCTALCNYVVATETRSWMSDVIKARQLYTWLYNHCKYEADNTRFYKFENQDYSSVFVSYGLNVRGSGIGESVCAGFSKAYTMLLTAAGIESYPVRASFTDAAFNQLSQEEKDFWGLGEFNRGGHAWNVVKINGKYYQCDVTNAVTGQRGYQPFLRTDADMWSIFHEGKYTPTELYLSQNGEHPYLSFQQAQGQAAINQCNNYFNDTNYDGILDGDVTLDGVFDGNDLVGMQLLSMGDWNWDGQVNEADAQLIQLYQYFCGNQPLTFATWLYFCIQIFGD